MFFRQSVLVVLLAASAYAQSTGTSSGPLPSSTSNLSPCLINCVTTSPGCTDFTDATCVCTNTDYQTAVAQCLQTSCTPADQQQAAALEASLCGSSSSDVSSSTTGLPSSLSSVLSSVSSRVSSRSSSLSSRLSSLTNTPTSTPTSTGGSGGAAGLTASLLATGGAVFLAVVGGGLFVF